MLQKKKIKNQDLANLKKFFEQSPLDNLVDTEMEKDKKEEVKEGGIDPS